ncbi:MAG: ABC transporter permease [Planctomycetes bacterium]|nr:ABC transporter permease [Planctomycetota bacterium]
MNTKAISMPLRYLGIARTENSVRTPTVQKKISRRLPAVKIWSTTTLMIVQTGILITAITLWELGARFGVIDPFFWSQPSAIWKTLLVFMGSGDALIDISFTFKSTILGFIIGTTGGALLGMSFWWSRNYALIMQPYIVCLESMPKLALAPLIILVFGMGLSSKVAIATALTLIVSTLTAYGGVRAVDKDQERLFYSLGASRWQTFRKLVVPSCIPWIISILRVNIGLALTGAIVGEFVSSQYGLGRTILYAGSTFEIALVWVAVLILSALSIVMYVAVGWLERFLLKGVAH